MGWMPRHLLHRLARWLLGAMLLATLAPAVSRTLAASHEAGDWVEICTVQGVRWMQLGGSEAGSDTGLSGEAPHVLDLCGHCVLTAERFAPLLPHVPVVAAFKEAWPTPGHIATAQRSVAALNPCARGPPTA